MDTRSCALAVCGLIIVGTASVNASVIFYTDVTAFNAAANTLTIDFEGLVADDQIDSADVQVINGISFTTDPQLTSAKIFGKNAGAVSTDSALFVADNGSDIVIDLSNGNFTAAGGVFGDYNGPGGDQVIFNVYDAAGIIDTQTVNFGNMVTGGATTFFGWASTRGEEIRVIEMLTDGVRFSALDDFQYGGALVPVPAAIWLFGSGLLGLVGFARSGK
jgi:hypothetical protein